MNHDDAERPARKVIVLHPGYAADHTPTHTLVDNTRRRRPDACEHKGPYTVDRALAAVECGDCGAYLNPIFVLQQLAHQEAYWNQRVQDLETYANALKAEIAGRSRTKCTHCGNMTAIKFEAHLPQTWIAAPP